MAKSKSSTSTTSGTKKSSNNPMKAVASKKKKVVRKTTTKRKKKSTGWSISGTAKRNIIALSISLVLIGCFYAFYIRPYSYRWLPCLGSKYYEVCMPKGYSIHGIDISRHQGEIDWKRLAANQVEEAPLHFVFMKATEGGDFKDKTYEKNMEKSRSHGFISGAYHFYSPRTSATKQARYFIKNVKLKSGDLPPVLDVEVFGKGSKEDFKDSVKVWLDIVEKNYKTKPIIYTSYKFKEKYLNDSIFNEYPFWIAHYYVSKVRYNGKWDFWQHTDIGIIDGIEERVDLNVFNGTLEELKAITLP